MSRFKKFYLNLLDHELILLKTHVFIKPPNDIKQSLYNICIFKIKEIIDTRIDLLKRNKANPHAIAIVATIVKSHIIEKLNLIRTFCDIKSDKERRIISYFATKIHPNCLTALFANDRESFCDLLCINISKKSLLKEEELQIDRIIDLIYFRGNKLENIMEFYNKPKKIEKDKEDKDKNYDEYGHISIFNYCNEKLIINSIPIECKTLDELKYIKKGLVYCKLLKMWIFPKHNDLLLELYSNDDYLMNSEDKALKEFQINRELPENSQLFSKNYLDYTYSMDMKENKLKKLRIKRIWEAMIKGGIIDLKEYDNLFDEELPTITSIINKDFKLNELIELHVTDKEFEVMENIRLVEEAKQLACKKEKRRQENIMKREQEKKNKNKKSIKKK